MRYFLITDPDFYPNVPTMGGVYRLHCFANDEGSDVMPVPRVLGVDHEGILYIGKATAFTDRVINLKKAISPEFRGTSHICGRRYKNPHYQSFGERFPASRLCVSFEPTSTPEKSEREALIAYVMRFGELPPLNRQG